MRLLETMYTSGRTRPQTTKMPHGCGSSSKYVISKPVMSSTLKSSMSVCTHHGSSQHAHMAQQCQCITGPLRRACPSGCASKRCALGLTSCRDAAGRGRGQCSHQDCCRKVEERHLEVVWVGVRIDVLAPDAAARALQACQVVDQYVSPASPPTMPFAAPQSWNAQRQASADTPAKLES